MDHDEIIRTRVPPDDIRCKTCLFKLPPVEVMGRITERHTFGTCFVFEDKPSGILWKHEDCELYKFEKEN